MSTSRSTWRMVLATGGLLVGGLAACGDDGSGGVSTTSSSTSDTTEPEELEIEGKVVATIAIGSGVMVDVAAGEGGIWVTSYSFGTVERIDPATDEVIASIPLGIRANPGGLAAGEGAVWVTNVDDMTLARIDPATNEVDETIAFGSGPWDVAVGEGSVWVTDGDAVSRVDPDTNEVIGTIQAPGAQGIAVGEGAVWATTGSEGGESIILYRVDPVTNEVTDTIEVESTSTEAEFGTGSVAVGEGAVWVTASSETVVTRIDAESMEIDARVPVVAEGPAPTGIDAGMPFYGGPFALEVGAGSVWATMNVEGAVARIDAATNEVIARIEVGAGPQGLAIGSGSVWVASSEQATLSRIDGHDATTTTTGTGPPEVVTLSGDGTGDTDVFTLEGGSYEAEFDLPGDCGYEAYLYPLSAGGVGASIPVVAGTGPTAGTWIVSDVERGEYFVGMVAWATAGEDATPSCPWSIVLTRR